MRVLPQVLTGAVSDGARPARRRDRLRGLRARGPGRPRPPPADPGLARGRAGAHGALRAGRQPDGPRRDGPGAAGRRAGAHDARARAGGADRRAAGDPGEGARRGGAAGGRRGARRRGAARAGPADLGALDPGAGARPRTSVGALDEPVEVGGAEIRPGDTVVLDADGVVVVRRERLDEVLDAAARARRARAGQARASSRRARCPTTSTACRAPSGGRVIHDLAHIGHAELLTPQARREPALLRAGARHGGRGARGSVGVPARVGRLPALQPQADRVRPGRSRAHGPARLEPRGARAPGRGDRGHRARPGLDRRRPRSRPRLPLHRSRRAHVRALLRDREVQPARAPAPVAEEPAAALRGTRRGGQAARPRERAGAGRRGQPRLRRRTCSASASTSGSSSTTAPRRAPG